MTYNIQGMKPDTDANTRTLQIIEKLKEIDPDIIGFQEINETLGDQPDIVNSDPYGEGWMVKIKISDENEWNSLMSDRDYKDLIG